ncbi:MAG: hypothetical protein ACE14U_06085 [Candidatus Velamenicoccus archaeovorus]
MSKTVLAVLIFAVGMICVTSGCAKRVVSSAQAIKKSETMSTTDQKAVYLVGQAKAFLNSKNYREAIRTSQYVLAGVDRNSKEARAILEKAKQGLSEEADDMMEDVKRSRKAAAK